MFVRCLSSGSVRSLKKKTCFSKTRGILLWKSEVFGWAEENWGTENDYTVAFEHLFGFSGLVCTVHPMIFSWQRVFRLLSLLFCISRRKLYFITNPKVLFYYMNINPSKGKENKAHLCLSLLIPEDTDTSLTLAWNRTSHSLYFTTGCIQILFLYLLRLISRLVSRWSYTTVLKIVIKSLQPRPWDCNFHIDPSPASGIDMDCGSVTAAGPPCAPGRCQCLW